EKLMAEWGTNPHPPKYRPSLASWKLFSVACIGFGCSPLERKSDHRHLPTEVHLDVVGECKTHGPLELAVSLIDKSLSQEASPVDATQTVQSAASHLLLPLSPCSKLPRVTPLQPSSMA